MSATATHIMDQDLQKRLERQDLEIAEIKARLHKIDRRFFWGRIFMWINILLFVVPLLVSIFYLKPLLDQGVGALIDPAGDGTSVPTDFNTLQKLLQDYNTANNQ